MDSKHFVSRDYDDVNVDDENDTDTEMYIDEVISTDEEFEEESVDLSTEIPIRASSHCWNNPSGNRRVVRYFLPVLTLAIGALLSLTWSLSSGSANPEKKNFLEANSNSTYNKIVAESEIISEPNSPSVLDSPFFEHVLEWREVPLADVYHDYINNSNSSGATEASSATSIHYEASIEFCSDPKNGLYGYGPVGNCAPGKAAPLIRMKPKRFYHLTLYNNAHISTNIHTHGLHVSGVGTADDVMRVAKPGECLTYEHYILDDADVGTYWYHPHHHPNITSSAYGGAYGMLIVDETDAVIRQFYPQHLINFLTKNEILLQFSSMYNEKLPNPLRSNKINGQDSLDLFLLPDTYYYFRVSSVVYDDSFNYLEFDPPDACNVQVIAYDGVYRSEIPGPNSLYKHMMTVGSRGDFAVSCTKNAHVHFHQGKTTDESKLVKIHVLTPSEKSSLSSSSPSSSNSPTTVSLEATLPSSPYWDQTAKTTWKPRRPYYMPDLSAPTNLVDEYWSVSMDDYFVNGTHGHTINQLKWDPHRSIRTFALGQLIEYPILRSQEHPYHTHINRMQIVEPGGCGGRFEEGEYFDTIAAQLEDKSSECRVRTKFFDFAGKVIIHCHRFEHEHHGMMAWIDVLGGDGHGTKAAPATSCAAVL